MKQKVSNKCMKNGVASLKKFLAPLKQGWVREVVYRASTERKKCDIYYHPPEGRKLRSKVEVGGYLKRNGLKNLTVKNFTYLNVLLGLGKPYEISRDAMDGFNCFGKRNSNDKPCKSKMKRIVKSGSIENIKPAKTQLEEECWDTSDLEYSVTENDEFVVDCEFGEVTGYEDWMTYVSFPQTDGSNQNSKEQTILDNILQSSNTTAEYQGQKSNRKKCSYRLRSSRDSNDGKEDFVKDLNGSNKAPTVSENSVLGDLNGSDKVPAAEYQGQKSNRKKSRYRLRSSRDTNNGKEDFVKDLNGSNKAPAAEYQGQKSYRKNSRYRLRSNRYTNNGKEDFVIDLNGSDKVPAVEYQGQKLNRKKSRYRLRSNRDTNNGKENFVIDLNGSDKAPAVSENSIVGVRKDQGISKLLDAGKTAVPLSSGGIQHDHIHHSDYEAQKIDTVSESKPEKAELQLEIGLLKKGEMPNSSGHGSEYSDEKSNETYTKKDKAADIVDFGSELKCIVNENVKIIDLKTKENEREKKDATIRIEEGPERGFISPVHSNFTGVNSFANSFPGTCRKEFKGLSSMQQANLDNQYHNINKEIQMIPKSYEVPSHLEKLWCRSPSKFKSESLLNSPDESTADEAFIMSGIAYDKTVYPSGERVSECEVIWVDSARPLEHLVEEQTEDESLPVISQVQSGEEVKEKFVPAHEEPLQLWYVPPTKKPLKNTEENEMSLKGKCNKVSLKSLRGLKSPLIAYSQDERNARKCSVTNHHVDCSLEHGNKPISNDTYSNSATPQQSTAKSNTQDSILQVNTAESVFQEDQLLLHPRESISRIAIASNQCSSSGRNRIELPVTHFRAKAAQQKGPVTIQMQKGKSVPLKNTNALQAFVVRGQMNNTTQATTLSEQIQLRSTPCGQINNFNKQVLTSGKQKSNVTLEHTATLTGQLNSSPLQTSCTQLNLFPTLPYRYTQVPQQGVTNNGQMNQSERQMFASNSQMSNFPLQQKSTSVGPINKPSLPQMITSNVKINHMPQRMSAVGIKQNNVLKQQITISNRQINSSPHQTSVSAGHAMSSETINVHHRTLASVRNMNLLPNQINTNSKQMNSSPKVFSLLSGQVNSLDQGIDTSVGQLNSVYQTHKLSKYVYLPVQKIVKVSPAGGQINSPQQQAAPLGGQRKMFLLRTIPSRQQLNSSQQQIASPSGQINLTRQ